MIQIWDYRTEKKKNEFKKRRLFKHKLKYVSQGIIFFKETGYMKVPNQAIVWVEQEQSEKYWRV